MAGITIFPNSIRRFERYEAVGDRGQAHIARLVGSDRSTSMGGGVVIYENVSVDWDLPFDEMIVVLEGAMRIHSAGQVFDCAAGDVAWFPTHTELHYEVPQRVVVFYATYPIAAAASGTG